MVGSALSTTILFSSTSTKTKYYSSNSTKKKKERKRRRMPKPYNSEVLSSHKPTRNKLSLVARSLRNTLLATPCRFAIIAVTTCGFLKQPNSIRASVFTFVITCNRLRAWSTGTVRAFPRRIQKTLPTRRQQKKRNPCLSSLLANLSVPRRGWRVCNPRRRRR